MDRASRSSSSSSSSMVTANEARFSGAAAVAEEDEVDERTTPLRHRKMLWLLMLRRSDFIGGKLRWTLAGRREKTTDMRCSTLTCSRTWKGVQFGAAAAV